MSWTLEIGGLERSLTDLGIDEAGSALFSRNGAASVLRLVKSGPMDGALLAAYDVQCILRRDRVGGPTSWTGGSIRFVGYADLPVRTGTGTAEAIAYEFRDWWSKAERVIYHQRWHQVTGIGPGGVKTYTDVPVPNVFLGVALDGTRWTNGEQIEDALDWLADRSDCVQLGTIDPAVNIFTTEARSVSVAEVIRTMLAHSPDAQIVTDYSTTPPTVSVLQNASLGTVTLTAGTDPITQLQLIPKHDLQVPVVVIHFRGSDTIDGDTYPRWTKQVYPANPGGYTDLEWETQIGAVITTIELEGSSTNYVKGSIVTQIIDANNATQATRIAWWQDYEKPLASQFIDPASIVLTTPTAVVDRAGAAVSLSAYPYQLIDGNYAPWMPLDLVTNVTVKATVSYNLYSVNVVDWQAAHGGALPPDSFIVKKVKDREIAAEVTVCDFDTAGEPYTFRMKASFAEGEPEPVGLAQAYYNSLATLRYAGSITDVHQELPDVNLLAHRLTLLGTGLAISDQLIQEVEENLGDGTRTIKIGPATVLDLTTLMDLHRVYRFRRVWNNPRLMTTGDPGEDGLELGANAPKQDTTSGNGSLGVSAVSSDAGSGSTNNLKLDAVNGIFSVKTLDATGTASAGTLLIELSRFFGKEIKIREAKVCLPSGATKYCLTLASEPYDDSIITSETPIGEE